MSANNIPVTLSSLDLSMNETVRNTAFRKFGRFTDQCIDNRFGRSDSLLMLSWTSFSVDNR